MSHAQAGGGRETAPTPREASGTFARLRELMIRIGLRTVPDMTKYGCRDFLRDHARFMTLKETHPTYLDEHVDRKTAATAADREMFAYMETRAEFKRLLRETTGALISVENLQQPLNAMAHESGRARFARLFDCKAHGVPSLFCGSQAYNAFSYQFEDRFTPDQKNDMIDLVSLLRTGKLACDSGDSVCRRLLASPFMKQAPTDDFVARLDAYEKADREFQKLFGSPQMKELCLREVSTPFAQFARACPAQSETLARILTLPFATIERTIPAEDFTVAGPENCDGRLRSIYGKSLSSPETKARALELYDKYHIFLNDGLGGHGARWTTERVEELAACLAELPPKYAAKLPLTAVVPYDFPSGNTAGWYWDTFDMLVLNGSGLDCGTAVHELAHAWDHKNKVDAKEGTLHQDWLKVGEFKAYPFRAPGEGSQIELACHGKFATAYARCNPSEDFAETVRLAVEDPWETRRRMPEKFAFLEKRVFAEPIDFRARARAIAARYDANKSNHHLQRLLATGDDGVAEIVTVAKATTGFEATDAMQALARGGPRGVAAVVDMLLGDDTVRRGVAHWSLLDKSQQINRRDATPDVYRALVARWPAARAGLLEAFRDPEGVAALLENLPAGKPILFALLEDPSFRFEVLAKVRGPLAAEIEKHTGKGLTALLAESRGPRIAAALEDLRRADPAVYGDRLTRAVRPFVTMGAVAIPDLTAIVQGPGWIEEAREAALKAIYEIDGPAARRLTEKLVADPSRRKLALKTIHLGGKASLPFLERLLRAEKTAGPDYDALTSQLSRLDGVGGRELAEKLIDELDDARAGVLVQKLLGFDYDRLADYLGHSREGLRAAALARFKSHRNRAKVHETLAPRLDAPDERTRTAARSLLEDREGLLYLAQNANPLPGSAAFEMLKKGAADGAVRAEIEKNAEDPKRPGMAKVLAAIR